MDWVTAKDSAELWGISTRRVQILCDAGRIEGATKLGNIWVIPKGATKPKDGRIKNGRIKIKEENKT